MQKKVSINFYNDSNQNEFALNLQIDNILFFRDILVKKIKGLKIKPETMKLMKGQIEVESVYGQGSTFIIFLPQRIVSEEPIGNFHQKFDEYVHEIKAYHELFKAPDAHILVVDDTDMNLTVIQGLLSKTEIQLDTASSGVEALIHTQDTKYDLILMDQRMPQMDGTETMNKIKAQENGMNNNTPVICLTADAVSGARNKYLEQGFTDYLSKPVESKTLEATLKKYLPENKVIIETETEQAETETKQKSELEEFYSKTQGLDYYEAIKNCATEDILKKTLEQFYNSINNNLRDIQKFYDEEDIKNYTIKVHALKSSARVIGAKDMSELARSLEEAGNNKDIVTINKNTYELLKQYEDMAGSLQILDKSEDDSLPPLDEAMRKDAYNTMIEVTNIMDYGMMESILLDLKKYKLEEEDSKRIDRINNMLLELDWDGISTELSSVK